MTARFGSFFFNDTATTEIYTLSLHDALPILRGAKVLPFSPNLLLGFSAGTFGGGSNLVANGSVQGDGVFRSEKHTSELQSRQCLVCRLLLEQIGRAYV